MSRSKRLYIITGKGGVGKTTIALALTKHLNSKGVKARYLNFTTSTLVDLEHDIQEVRLAKSMGIPHCALKLKDTAVEFVGRKLKSQTVGSWVVKTPFFKALLSMIPGFNYLLYLGKTLDMLKNDPELVLVLDSPSSGHALTMLEATKNFGEIFQTGILFDETQRMIGYLYADGFTQINILSLPTLMAANEAIELEKELASAAPISSKVFCNNSFKEMQGIDKLELPPFLEAKFNAEKEIEKRLGEHIHALIKHSLSNEDGTIIDDLVPDMEKLI